MSAFSSYQRLFDSLSQHTLDADILSAAMASPRHPIPFPAILDSDFVQCLVVALAPSRTFRVTKKDGFDFGGARIPKCAAAFSASGRRKFQRG
ncbi:hypothetical protein CFAM422_010969 [Trichoderma lentiforme]|uniref:Uncharacterized protein n=1 Tax=Trichoderma lentiforme TaxID=1567552 RepID=A0A9P4X7H9_9HYPO|nr:hypothetical protein CFAM422_010969 [Trichoderma lentiforme]